ncbi:GNAT family N-acetyltransferase [Halopolyspora algeriensis]|uniref:GNAT family N-acetyltransferase n=1 Tax=Halopolyspora algeriensis TaxID=1500506 RepID=UPI000DF39F35|nr:GNAT family N-acetyltransferase [Halopolyspora algeriensis]
MLSPDYPVETERLLLRPFHRDDLGDFHAYHSRADVVRYLFQEVHGLEQARVALERNIGRAALTEEGQRLILAVATRQDGQLVGEIHLEWLSRKHRQGEIGFIFNPEYQGRGFASEAAWAVLGLGFEDLGLHRIVGHCDARNHPSARLMERLGMRREAHLVHHRIFKGEWDEEFVYAILEREWRER